MNNRLKNILNNARNNEFLFGNRPEYISRPIDMKQIQDLTNETSSEEDSELPNDLKKIPNNFSDNSLEKPKITAPNQIDNIDDRINETSDELTNNLEDKTIDLEDNEFKQAQKQSADNQFYALLNRISGKLGTSIANLGATQGPGVQNSMDDVNESLQKTATTPLEMLKAKRNQYEEMLKNKRSMQMSDPSSSASKTYRELYSSLGGKVAGDETAAELEELIKYAQQRHSVEEAKKDRRFNREQARDSKLEREEGNKLAFAKSIEDKILSLDSVKSYEKIKTSSETLNYLSNLPASKQTAANQTAALYEFIKALDPNSVVREGEVKLLGEARNLPDSVQAKLQKFSNVGAVLTPQEIKDLANFVNSKLNFAKVAATSATKNYRELAKAKGVDKYLTYQFNDSEVPSTSTPSDTKTLIKKQYSPSANKTKLIYSDGTEEVVDGKK